MGSRPSQAAPFAPEEASAQSLSDALHGFTSARAIPRREDRGTDFAALAGDHREAGPGEEAGSRTFETTFSGETRRLTVSENGVCSIMRGPSAPFDAVYTDKEIDGLRNIRGDTQAAQAGGAPARIARMAREMHRNPASDRMLHSTGMDATGRFPVPAPTCDCT